MKQTKSGAKQGLLSFMRACMRWRPTIAERVIARINANIQLARFSGRQNTFSGAHEATRSLPETMFDLRPSMPSDLSGDTATSVTTIDGQNLTKEEHMDPHDSTAAVDYTQLDDPLADHLLLSTRVRNALLRHHIITLRLLIMYTPELLAMDTDNLGAKGLAEIEAKLAVAGWSLAEAADQRQVRLTMTLIAVLRASHRPMQLSDIIEEVHHFSGPTWSAAGVEHILTHHPYFEALPDGRYRFWVHAGGPPGVEAIAPVIQSEEATPDQEPPPAQSAIGAATASALAEQSMPALAEPELIQLSELWPAWIGELKPEHRDVLLLSYGVQGEAPMTLQDVGDGVGLTRERIRQIKHFGLRELGASNLAGYREPLHRLLSEAVKQADNLLSPSEWEQWLDRWVTWDSDEQRPSLLYLLCDLFADFQYVDDYDVVTPQGIGSEHLKILHSTLKILLSRQQGKGLTADELVHSVQASAPTMLPPQVLDSAFILKAASLFNRVRIDKDGRYFYWKYRQQLRRFAADIDWWGTPGTRLHEWETRLRDEFAHIAWIGQLRLTEGDFIEMCRAIQAESRTPNYFSKVEEGNPRLVPPAVFVTTMVLSARYTELTATEAVDEFWTPYLRTVWDTPYSQTFYARCKQRFNAVVPLLEKQFGFEFPRAGWAHGDVVTPLFRHALIPRYMQHDFAAWLRKSWRDILEIAEVPALLAAYLQQDRSLDLGYSHRLKHFITGSATAVTAASLITNMSAAISLHVNDGESIEHIGALLSDTPIEQELWREIALEFTRQKDGESAPARVGHPKVTWVWSLDRDELNLRVQNIVLPVTAALVGSPNRVVWLAAAEDDPLRADIEEEVIPWRMKTGERIIADVLLREPEGPAGGSVALLTDEDEVAARLDVPQHPAGKVQFFRPIQQGAYGIPLDAAQITDGPWLVCAEAPLTLLDEDDEAIVPDSELPVPYPLGAKYTWAAQLTLNLPVKVMQGDKCVTILEAKESQPNWAPPALIGDNPIAQLSRQVQPTFADMHVAIKFDYDGERLLKQASLWLKGQDGWRYQRSLAELFQHGHATLVGDVLTVELASILPLQPNVYTVELRASLIPISPVPLQFAVVPGLAVEPPTGDLLYTAANPPQAILYGLDNSHLVHNEGLLVQPLPGQGLKITWTDLRHDPALLLRFGQVVIPLAWSVPHFAAWLEPKSSKPFLTLDELHRTTLHAVGAGMNLNGFTLSIGNQTSRYFSLSRGRYRNAIGQTQLYDMVRLAAGRVCQVDVQVGAERWPLFEVRSRPQLSRARIGYDKAQQLLRFDTGLTEHWTGDVRFWAESLTKPFAPPVELGRAAQIEERHTFHLPLAEGVYVFHLELDGVDLLLPKAAVSLVIGDDGNPPEEAEELIQAIRSGQIIPRRLAEYFVLLWAENAELGAAGVTSTTLYQLATIAGSALENFQVNHLRRLWPPLASLHAARAASEWVEEHGLLPAWIILEQPVILKTTDRGFQLPVCPVYVAQGGRTGKGCGRWRLSEADGVPKEFVYVEWGMESAITVHAKAALPEKQLVDWAEADLLDMYGLQYCTRCGRLTGAKAIVLPEEICREHKHGNAPISLRDITLPAEHGGHKLLAEFYIDRRAPHLADSYATFEIAHPSAAAYLPEPRPATEELFAVLNGEGKLAKLIRDLVWWGDNSDERSLLASASRLLSGWHHDHEISHLGQAAFALGVLLRFAAHNPSSYRGLLKSCALTESDVQELLVNVNQSAPAHLEWGLTWAELLVVHSA